MKYDLKFFKKLVFILFILSVQTFFIYLFYKNENFFLSFKWDYIGQIYLPVYRWEFEHGTFLKNNTSAATTNTTSFNEKSIPVLLYHGIVEKPDGYNTSVDNFRDEMMALKSAGYQTVTLDDFYKFARGEKQLPAKSFLLTFDDGRKDSYYPADPLLKALNYNAVMFVITKYINSEAGSFYLSKEELDEMTNSGRWELEAHTQNGHDMMTIGPQDQKGHFYSNKLWLSDKGLETDSDFQERIFNDFVGARNDLENNFGKRPIALAFPFGDYGQNAINLGYSKTETTIFGITRYAYPISFYQVAPGNGFMENYFGENNHLFKRIDVRPEWTPNDLLAILHAGEAKNLPFRDDFSEFNGWFSSDGNNEFTKNTFVLKAPLDSSNALSFLEGSKFWGNYVFSAQLDWNRGNKVGIITRYSFDTNYLACEITDNNIQLVSIFNGKYEVLNTASIQNYFPPKNLNMSVEVEGSKITCSLDNQVMISSDKIRNEQLSGGVGFLVSDDTPGKAEAIIRNVSVKENQTNSSRNNINPVGKRDDLLYNNNNIGQQTSDNTQK